MASFDFIDASAKGYELVWRDRGYLSRVAVPVLFVKVACLLAVFVLGAQTQYLRQGLILLPSQIVEAIFVIGLIRYVLYREPIFIWGRTVPMPESDVKTSSYQGWMNKKQCVQAGIATYLLLKVVAGGISAWLMDNFPLSETPPAVSGNEALPPLAGVIAMFFMLTVFTWSFRLLWIYIPIAMGYPFVTFLKKIAGMRSSVSMIATWLVCFLPPVVLFVSCIQVFSDLFPEGSAANIIVQSILEGGAEIILISVQVVAMTYGIKQMLRTTMEE